MSRLESVQIASPAFKADPYPFYARLRAETPVYRVALPNKQPAWLVTRYDDVAALLKDPRFAKDRQNALTKKQMASQPQVPALFAPLTRNLLDSDDPDHARLRRLAQTAFTAKRIEVIVDRTQAACDERLDRLKGRRFDLMGEFALPVPVMVISELLGVPQADREKFGRWSKTLSQNTMTPMRMLLSFPHLVCFVRYLRRLIAQKQKQPQDDLVSALVQVQATGQLDEDELLAMVALLLTAGHETTTNLIGNGMLALLRHLDQFERLRAQPELIETAIEELLRFESPVEMSTNRYAREDLEIAGTPIARGELVLGVIASANRDESQFPDAHTLDIARRPNLHLAFGQGGHYCLGAALARLEGKIALETLLRRLPNLRLTQATNSLRWRRGLVLRGLESLAVSF
ncbi:cytochrome P450 family protein [Gloeobacter kilaueensis]|uniref:Cytochrome P450 n=1 Tax=Gloeobacter kilaueensis (strain ATCC BAA-2537 / CCAP 1431/1 / ULC 316 / JS1) TaxID=1183438 RepID=U5QJB5_GLOK1|nr:cytochrome P450 [Gloeobacter kilaueensis]AGY57714.1 cytochrome P450 [Gloeobacter kilaueensis JS1]